MIKLTITSKKYIIVNFIIQKLKSKHTSLKKYTNWDKLSCLSLYIFLSFWGNERRENQIFRTKGCEFFHRKRWQKKSSSHDSTTSQENYWKSQRFGSWQQGTSSSHVITNSVKLRIYDFFYTKFYLPIYFSVNWNIFIESKLSKKTFQFTEK